VKGLLERRDSWRLSRRGWAVFLAVLAFTAVVFFLGVHPFLAPTQRVHSDVLVVEGWIHEYGIRGAAEEFGKGSYRRAVTTGGPVVGIGGYRNDFQTSASVGADNLVGAGLPADRVTMVPSRVSGRDRTYSSAVALRLWLQTNEPTVRKINVLTEDAHGRRTRLLFEKALGPGYDVGIISIPSPDYDPKRWWRYSEGVRTILGETIAYLYVRLFFWPSSKEGLPEA
jgi:uncharacterized SAM-binding protein YcdF (DUF218 family)